MEPYREPEIKRSKTEFLIGLFCGLAIGLALFSYKVTQVRAEAQSVQESAAKELTDLRATVATLNAKTKDCNSVLLGDGTKTILMDPNHPYGKFVPAANNLPNGYIPGPVWIINRKVTPRTMDGTLNGAYAYEHPDGSIEGWFSPGQSREAENVGH
jgi:hypothetical protein